MANIDNIGNWKTSEFEDYFTNSHRFGGSSDMFKQIREQLKELKELDAMPVTKELAEGRRLLLEMIQETSAKYVRERSGASSSQGKERLEVAQALERFCASEIPLMKSEKKVEYFAGKSFDDIRSGIDTNQLDELSKQMHTVQSQPMTEENVIKYTNLLSKYIPMAEAYLDDERTKEQPMKQAMQRQVDTYKSAIDQMRDFRNVKKLIAENKGWNDLNSLRNARIEWNQPIEKTGANVSQRIKLEHNGKKGFFSNEVYFTTHGKDVTLTFDYKKFISSEILNESHTKDLLTLLKFQDAMVNITKKVGLHASKETAILDSKKQYSPESKEFEIISEMENNPVLLKKCADIIDKARKTKEGMVAGNLTGNGEIEFSRRNVAATRVAELLGIGNMLAHSEIMTVVINGVEHKGCFMEFAEGVDPTVREGADFEKLAETEFKRNASYNHAESNLEILDVLCGQMDRHGKNFFYKLSEKQSDGTRQIVGMQGIDNDLSFTTTKKITQGQGVVEDSMIFIDKELAENIRNLSHEKIVYALGDVLKPNEIEAFEARLDLVKEHMKTKMVEIDKDGWDLNEFDESKYHDLSQLDLRTRNYIKGIRDLKENDSKEIHRSYHINVELKAVKKDMEELRAKAERTAKADDIISQITAKKTEAQATSKAVEKKEPVPATKTTRTSFAEMTGQKGTLRKTGITIGSAAKAAEKKSEVKKLDVPTKK